MRLTSSDNKFSISKDISMDNLRQIFFILDDNNGIRDLDQLIERIPELSHMWAYVTSGSMEKRYQHIKSMARNIAGQMLNHIKEIKNTEGLIQAGNKLEGMIQQGFGGYAGIQLQTGTGCGLMYGELNQGYIFNGGSRGVGEFISGSFMQTKIDIETGKPLRRINIFGKLEILVKRWNLHSSIYFPRWFFRNICVRVFQLSML